MESGGILNTGGVCGIQGVWGFDEQVEEKHTFLTKKKHRGSWGRTERKNTDETAGGSLRHPITTWTGTWWYA